MRLIILSALKEIKYLDEGVVLRSQIFMFWFSGKVAVTSIYFYLRKGMGKCVPNTTSKNENSFRIGAQWISLWKATENQ